MDMCGMGTSLHDSPQIWKWEPWADWECVGAGGWRWWKCTRWLAVTSVCHPTQRSYICRGLWKLCQIPDSIIHCKWFHSCFTTGEGNPSFRPSLGYVPRAQLLWRVAGLWVQYYVYVICIRSYDSSPAILPLSDGWFVWLAVPFIIYRSPLLIARTRRPRFA